MAEKTVDEHARLVGELGSVLDKMSKDQDAGHRFAELVKKVKSMTSLRTEI